jgi:formylglycine-generating enzyme required for sulfatase activity
MNCPSCGKETPDDRDICVNCGSLTYPYPLHPSQIKRAAAPSDGAATVVSQTPGGPSTPSTPSPTSSKSEEDDIRAALSDRYEFIRKLGAGGMATVYLAREIALNREVAIKVLPRALLRDSEFIERFKNEARVAANLEHPHIVRIYQIGEEKDLCYFVMSHIPGGSIGDEIKKRGTIDLDDLIQWGIDACSALGYAHDHGVIHRDLKPDNIMLDKGRRAVVMDFGIARAAIGTRLTQTGSIIGTPQYMSPEQARGKDIDRRSDIYSFGLVLYQMATGTLPFQSPDAASLMYMHVHEAPAPPDTINPKVPAWLRDIILKCLAKNPEDRFATAAELKKALAERQKPKLTKTMLMPERAAGRKKKGIMIGFAAAFVVIALAAGAYWWFVLRPAPSPVGTVSAPGAAAPGTEATREDDSSFRQAEMVNTEQAYTVYLKSYPSGVHAAEAKSRIESIKAGTPVKPTPASPAPSSTQQAPQVATRETPPPPPAAAPGAKSTDASRDDNLAFQQAEMVNTKQSYTTYLKNYPSGLHSADAKAKIDAISGEETKTASAQAEENARKDDQAFQLAENTRTAEAYKTYLIAFPSGRHAPDAKTRIDAIEKRASLDDQVRVILNTLSMKMLAIPGGAFIMGSDKGNADEKPAHTVNIAPFQMGETEVTQSQYQGIMSGNPSFFKGGSNNPVDRTTWFDAITFCNRLSEKAKLDPCYNLASGECDYSKSGFRLPTEAEWEYACRAETGGDYYTGDGPANLGRAGWYQDNSGDKTHSVGQKAPNAWKLFDTHGNVWEWTNDWYGKDFYGSSSKQNPTGPASGSEKVIRGGSWVDNATSCKAAKRRSFNPKKNYSDIGFRVVRK